MDFVKDNPALRLRLLRELALRLHWTALPYALFATLFSLNLRPGVRGIALSLSGLLVVFGFIRTLFARRVIAGQDTERDGRRLIQVARILSLTFGAFVAYAFWHVWGQVIPECLVLVGVAGLSSVGASEATARIRSLPGSASLVPIIGVTANAFAEDRECCLRAGMNGYAAKPLSRAALMAAMSQFLPPTVNA